MRISDWSSDVCSSDLAWGIFLTPCESDPPRVLQLLVRNMSDRTPDVVPELATSSLFEQAIADPFMNALHRTLLERQPRAKSERLSLDGLIARLQENGSQALNRAEKRDLLCDATSMATLHRSEEPTSELQSLMRNT